ncbi:hypothetical protein EDD18DRAFT_1350207 [Armillaria luteobubalina]|uniref:Uncharacterized protein n=1 Tax=Armillaria luteobubalina TaxID=153913 RepID=A0AA39UYX5_9AGAR|nr:hypothetical protein EDD18DRAFT_1350207 [Armillaria luteobubalina]
MHANPSSSFNSNLKAFPLATDATSNDAPPPEDNNYADLPELTKIDSNDEETDYDADSEDSDTETLVDQTIPADDSVSKAPHVNMKGFGAKLKALAMKACPKVFRKKVGNPPDRKWSLNIETGDNPPVKICGRPHSPPEHEAI